MKVITVAILSLAFIVPIQADQQFEIIGHWGYGPYGAVETRGTTMFRASGCVLEILDFVDAENPVLLGKQRIPDTILRIVDDGDRLVLGTAGGLAIVDISDLATPEVVTFLDWVYQCRAVAVDGDLVFVGGGITFQIIDISDPNHCEQLSALTECYGYPTDIAVDGDRVYLSTELPGALYVINVSDPEAPAILGSYDSPFSYVFAVELLGNAALICESFGLRVLNVSIPEAITEYGHFPVTGAAYDLEMDENLGYVANGSEGLVVLDLSDLTSPDEIGRFSLDQQEGMRSLDHSGDRLYVLDRGWPHHGLLALDVATPSEPTELCFHQDYGQTGVFKVHGGIVYGASETMRTVDISSPATPLELAHFPDIYNLGWDMEIVWPHAYILQEYALGIYDVSNPEAVTTLGSFNNYPVSNRNLSVMGDSHAFVVGGDGEGLRVFDVSDPTNLTIIHVFNEGTDYWDVQVRGTLAYLASEGEGLQILDVSTPTSPVLLGSAPAAAPPRGLDVDDDKAYMMVEGGLRIYDVSNSASPSYLGGLTWGGSRSRIEVNNGIACIGYSSSVIVIDVSDPYAPLELGWVQCPVYTGSVQVVDMDDEFVYVGCGDAGFVIIGLNSGVDVDPASPVGFLDLGPNYPNPFNPATTLQFDLPRGGVTRLSIHDAEGRLLKTLIDGNRGPGEVRAVWDGKDLHGHLQPSGCYFARLECEDAVVTRKMILLK